MLLSPQYLENVLQIYTVKRIRMKEKDETHVTVIDIYKHYPILFSYIVQHCLDLPIVGYCCCFVIFGLTTNTDEKYQSFH